MGIKMDDPPDLMGLAALEKRCQHEISNFRKGEAYDDRYCLEIFYRALKKRDDQAFELLVRNFRGVAIGWLRSHPGYENAMRHESEDNYVIDAFTRMWRAKHDQDMDFPSLAAALTFLKRCLNSAVLDTLRAHARQLLPLPEVGSGFPEEPAVREEDDGWELWEAIQSFLPTERERQLAYLRLHCNLKPREIMRFRPGMFSDVNEVNRLYRNIIERLTRNVDQIRWRLGDQEE